MNQEKGEKKYMDYSTFKFKYQLYLESVSRNQSDILRYTSECACLESGDIAGISSINEAVMDGIKNAIQKIIAAISTIWKKFVERANELLTTDNSFLEKYKAIITGKPPKSKDITMYQYNMEALKIAVPEFTYDQKMKTWLTSEDTEGTFASTFMPTAKLKEDSDIKEAIEALVRGENEVDMDGKNLDMKKMYEFCANYKATVELIKKDTDTILKSQGDVNKLLGQLAPKVQAAEDAKNKEASAKPQNPESSSTTNTTTGGGNNIAGGDMANQAKPAEEKHEAVYSNVYKTYVTELNVGAAKEPEKTASSSGANTNGAKVNNGVKNNTIVSKDTIKTMGDDVANSDKEEFDSISNNAPVFFKCCGNVLAAKLTVCHEIQKTYMTLIRAHVRDYVGETEK